MTHLVIATAAPHVAAGLRAVPDRASALVLDLEAEEGRSGVAAAAREAGTPTVTLRELSHSDVRVRTAVIVEPAGAHAVAVALALRALGCPVGRVELDAPVSLVAEAVSRELLGPVPPGPPAATSSDTAWSLRAAAARRPDWSAEQQHGLLGEDYPGHRSDREAMAALRDSHRGETCVIIGNGPSLNKIDFGLLPGVATFGVNSLFLARDRMGFDPTFYVVEDSAVMADNTDAIREMQARELKLFPAMYRGALDERSVGPTVFFTMNRGFYTPTSPNYCTPRFSTAAEERVYAGQSVTIINLQLAYHFGFTRVVLVGMDFSYVIPDSVQREGVVFTSTEDDPNHFDPRYFGAGKKWKDPQLARVASNYELARAVYAADGREIINSTVGGMLDVFPRLDLADALAGAPAPATAS